MYSSIKGPGWQIFLPQPKHPIDVAIESCYNKADEELDLNEKQKSKLARYPPKKRLVIFEKSQLEQIIVYTGGCKIDKESLKILLEMEWACLQTLNLSHIKLGKDGIAELMNKSWCKLKNLNLNNVDAGNEGIKSIVCGKIQCNQLQAIQIIQNQIDHVGIAQFTCQPFSHLIKLDLSDNILTCQSFKMLSKCQFQTINKLVLDSRCQNNEGIINLTKSSWKNLHTLSLYGNRSRISLRSINFIVYSCWPNLQYLNTWEDWPISALILMSLLQSPKMKNTPKYANKELINKIRAYRLEPL